MMKKISYLTILVVAIAPITSNAANLYKQLRREISRGLEPTAVTENKDIVTENVTVTEDSMDDTVVIEEVVVYEEEEKLAPGELGADVYGSETVDADATRVFIPATMYMRMGGGLNFGQMTSSAEYAGETHNAHAGYATHFGLGWNLSSYVRGEIDLMTTNLEFKTLDDMRGTYYNLGTMLYFDLARRYVMTGDVTYRRHVVPFIGVGVGAGLYEFQGAGGADGFDIAAPRAALGVNVRLNDLVSVELAYQYQMIIGNGYGWDGKSGGVDNISNVIMSLRAEF